MAIGNPLEIGVSVGTPPINSVFSVAMFDDTGGYIPSGYVKLAMEMAIEIVDIPINKW